MVFHLRVFLSYRDFVNLTEDLTHFGCVIAPSYASEDSLVWLACGEVHWILLWSRMITFLMAENAS